MPVEFSQAFPFKKTTFMQNQKEVDAFLFMQGIRFLAVAFLFLVLENIYYTQLTFLTVYFFLKGCFNLYNVLIIVKIVLLFSLV